MDGILDEIWNIGGRKEIKMTNLEKYKKAFAEGLEIEMDKVVDTLEYEAIPEWDSVGHMNLVSCIEDAFDIMMETDDIIDFNSFQKGIELLKKYEVEID